MIDRRRSAPPLRHRAVRAAIRQQGDLKQPEACLQAKTISSACSPGGEARLCARVRGPRSGVVPSLSLALFRHCRSDRVPVVFEIAVLRADRQGSRPAPLSVTQPLIELLLKPLGPRRTVSSGGTLTRSAVACSRKIERERAPEKDLHELDLRALPPLPAERWVPPGATRKWPPNDAKTAFPTVRIFTRLMFVLYRFHRPVSLHLNEL